MIISDFASNWISPPLLDWVQCYLQQLDNNPALLRFIYSHPNIHVKDTPLRWVHVDGTTVPHWSSSCPIPSLFGNTKCLLKYTQTFWPNITTSYEDLLLYSKSVWIMIDLFWKLISCLCLWLCIFQYISQSH